MFFDIPNKDGVWVYNTGSSAWLTWAKPPQYNNFIFYVCGGGGSGGSGANGGSSANLGGGGGGGGGCLSTLYAPSFLLPDVLYIQIGKGAAGTTGQGISGSNGGITYLAYYPNTNTANLIISSGGGVGGGEGKDNAGGSSGAGGAAYSSQSIFSYTSIPGGAGTNGGFTTVGGTYTSTVSCIFGGTGGGGGATLSLGGVGTFAGGAITGSNIFPTITPVVGTASISGFLIGKPFTAIGGTGGTGTSAAGGGAIAKGADGTWGSGGGGGGGVGNNGGVNTGLSGAGGDGFVIIIGY